VPIRGEAGLGYVLGRDFRHAAVDADARRDRGRGAGAQWVAERGDAVLAAAARDLIAKIEAAVPERLRPFIAEPTIGAPANTMAARDGLDIAKTRAWIRAGRKIRIRYRDEHDADSERTIWPVIIGYAETVRLLAAWCELRQDFRHFRTDRIVAADFLDARHGARPGEAEETLETQHGERARRAPAIVGRAGAKFTFAARRASP